MSVANELTSEVAMAMLKSDEHGEREDMVGILLALHSTLRSLRRGAPAAARAILNAVTSSTGR